jgi:hypothetical protein
MPKQPSTASDSEGSNPKKREYSPESLQRKYDRQKELRAEKKIKLEEHGRMTKEVSLLRTQVAQLRIRAEIAEYELKCTQHCLGVLRKFWATSPVKFAFESPPTDKPTCDRSQEKIHEKKESSG